MWTKTKSLLLSRILTAVMSGVVLLLTFFVPTLARWYNGFSAGEGLFGDISIVVPMCCALYICEVMAIIALRALHILLKNISNDEVFVTANTVCLRQISWMCMLAGCVFFLFGLCRFIFLFAAFLAIMVGLIIRVLKNVFEEAVEIKSENDFTI